MGDTIVLRMKPLWLIVKEDADLLHRNWVFTAYGTRSHLIGGRRFSKRHGRDVEHTLCGRPTFADADSPIFPHGSKPCSICVDIACITRAEEAADG